MVGTATAGPNAGDKTVVALDPVAQEVQSLNNALTKFGDTPGDPVKPIWEKEVQPSVVGAQILNKWEARVRRSLKKLAKDMYELLSGLNNVPHHMANTDAASARNIARAVPGASSGASTSAPSKSAIQKPTINGSDKDPDVSEPSPSGPDKDKVVAIADEIENYKPGSTLPSTWDNFEHSIQAIQTQLQQSAKNLSNPNVLLGKTASVTLEKLNAMTSRAERLDQVIKNFRNLAQKYVAAHDQFKKDHPSKEKIKEADDKINQAREKLTEAQHQYPPNMADVQNKQKELDDAQHYRYGSSNYPGGAIGSATLIDQSQTARQNFTQTVNDLKTEAEAAAPSDVDSDDSQDTNTAPKGGAGGGGNQSNGQQQQQQPKMPQMPKPNQGQGQGQQPNQGQGQQPQGQGQGNKSGGGQGDPDGGMGGMPPGGLNPYGDGNDPGAGSDADDDADPSKKGDKDPESVDSYPDGSGSDGTGGGPGDQSLSAGLGSMAMGAYPAALASALRGLEGMPPASPVGAGASGLGAGGMGQGMYPPMGGMGGMNGAKGSSRKNQYGEKRDIYVASLAGVLPGPVVGSKPPALPEKALTGKGSAGADNRADNATANA